MSIARKMARKKNKKAFNHKNFLPDAGIHSPDGINHYWFRVQDILNASITGNKNKHTGDFVSMMLNVPVDVMDINDEKHVAPKTDKGYLASFIFPSKQSVMQLADEIDKGSMNIRIAGFATDVETTIIGEKVRNITVMSSWGRGNNAGLMNFFYPTPSGISSTNTKEIANHFRYIITAMESN